MIFLRVGKFLTIYTRNLTQSFSPRSQDCTTATQGYPARKFHSISDTRGTVRSIIVMARMLQDQW